MSTIVTLMCLIILAELTKDTYLIVIAMIMGTAFTGTDITNMGLAILLFALSTVVLVRTCPDFQATLTRFHKWIRSMLFFWRRG